MGVVVGIGSQNPRPFGFAQGRLCVCEKRRHKDGAALGVKIRERVGQPPMDQPKAEVQPRRPETNTVE